MKPPEPVHRLMANSPGIACAELSSRTLLRSCRLVPCLFVLFVGSGCAALIYEIVWFQLLQLVIGLTNVSLGLVLGTFMGGMCLGSLLLPRFISPRRHPLRVYGLLELGIGAIGIAMLFVVPWVAQLYSANAERGLPGQLLRGVVTAVCLLPPTVLMGATLPIVARWIETTRHGVSRLGLLYGGNIAGAVFGCLLAGFYLLRVHDMATATCVAASINLVVALLALALAGRTTLLATESDAVNVSAVVEPNASDEVCSRTHQCSDDRDAEEDQRSVAARHWPVYVTIALSGLTALGAEVVWTRLLSLLLGGTVYTFSIILAVFLAGLGIGSGAGSLLARSTPRPRLVLGGCQLLLAAGIAWSAYMIARSLPYWPINPSLSLTPWFNFQLDLARCLWVILPPTILWGASFPLALAAVAKNGQDSAKLVGGVYAANTVGAILGALGFSLLVVPWIGTQGAERLLIGVAATAGLLALAPLLWAAPSGALRNSHDDEVRAIQSEIQNPGSALPQSVAVSTGRNRAARFIFATATVALLALTAFLVWNVPAAPWGLAAYGRFMATYGDRLAPGIVAEKNVPSSSRGADIFCTYMGEGLNGTIAVTKWTSGVRAFHSAGKVQASSEPRDMRLQRMLGHLSALAHKKPESVLVVACGAGVTAGAFVVHPEVKRIVICDIEPLVPKIVAPMFEKENHGVTRDPRTELILDDGRHFVRTTREKFDIITSDPIDPWVKGCAALNTVEYYEMCKAHLKPGGVMSLWLPLYESNSETTKSLIATFFKVFPNGILWSNDSEGEGYDAVLFGQTGQTQFDLDELQARLNREDHARVKQSLKEVGYHSVMGLLSTYAGQASELTEWLRHAQMNTDRNLRLQYLAGLALNSNMGSEILTEIGRYYKFPDKLFVGSDALKQILKTRLDGSGVVRSDPDALSASDSNDVGLPNEERKSGQ
jgi:spermidine synthase